MTPKWKTKVTFLSSILKVEEKKVSLLFHFKAVCKSYRHFGYFQDFHKGTIEGKLQGLVGGPKQNI